MNDIPRRISFKPLTKDDLELVHKWRLADHVSEWFKPAGLTLDQIREKYRPRISGEQKSDCFLILIDQKPIGLIQTYRIDDHPEYKAIIKIDENAAGVDLYIGETDYLHKGLGSHILRAFMTEIVFTRFDVDSCVIGPDPRNTIAIRAYEKAGFRYLKTIFNPDENEEEYLMIISKEAACGGGSGD